jgi:nitrite reductase/ring-hydroxylating ferredoxin subunit
MNELTVRALEQMEDPGSKGMTLDRNGEVMEAFVIKKEGGFFAYINHCPHTGVPLDWVPDQFLNRDKSHIQCAMHGALFEIETGLCVHGPCINRRLESVPLNQVIKL